MWCLLERSGPTSSIDITLGELYIDPLANVVYMYVLCSIGCPNACSYPGGLKEIPAWRVHEKDPTKVSTVSVDCNYSYNLCLMQAVLIFATSMFPASLVEPDPYAGGEGLVTCNTRSCFAVLYRPAPIRLQLFFVTIVTHGCNNCVLSLNVTCLLQ